MKDIQISINKDKGNWEGFGMTGSYHFIPIIA